MVDWHAVQGGRDSWSIARTELLLTLRNPSQTDSSSGKGGPGEGFDVGRYGDSRVALIGFPSVGKSTLLTQLTGTDSEAAAYEFTTLTCIPGVIHYNDAKIQLLDLPGIIEGAAQGKGRGRQVIAVCKSADLLLMVLDASKSHGHKEILTRELESCGIRLNKRPPNVYFKLKKTGGVSYNTMVVSAECLIGDAERRAKSHMPLHATPRQTTRLSLLTRHPHSPRVRGFIPMPNRPDVQCCHKHRPCI